MLYHGSKNLIRNYIEPHTSFDYKPLVYATDNILYALVRCGNFNVTDIAIREDYNVDSYTLVELRDHAFLDVFMNEGYIYVLDDRHFHKNPDNPNEYISEEKVPIIGKIFINNVFDQIFSNRDYFNIVLYCESDKWFADNELDKEAYLQRRQNRIRKIMNNIQK